VRVSRLLDVRVLPNDGRTIDPPARSSRQHRPQYLKTALKRIAKPRRTQVIRVASWKSSRSSRKMSVSATRSRRLSAD